MRTRLLWMFVLCVLPLTCIAGNLQGLDRYSSRQTVSSIGHDVQVQAELLKVLGPDYSDFSRNFEVWAAPAKLRDGGLFVEGWQKGAYLKKTSVFVIYPDGRIYAAYLTNHGNILRYYTNARNYRNTLHPAIKVWYRILDRPVNILYMPSEKPSYGASFPSLDKHIFSMAPEALSPKDQEHMRDVAAAIWGQSLANGWEMNESVGNVLANAVNGITTCSAAFALVPKPPAMVPPGWLWVATNSARILAYITGVDGNRIYQTCVVAAAADYRTAIELASMGI